MCLNVQSRSSLSGWRVADMARSRRAIASDTSNDDDDEESAVIISSSPSLKWAPGSSGKDQRARAKAMRNRQQNARRNAQATPAAASLSDNSHSKESNTRASEAMGMRKLVRVLDVASGCENCDVVVELARGAVASVEEFTSGDSRLKDIDVVRDGDGRSVYWRRERGDEDEVTSSTTREFSRALKVSAALDVDAFDALPQEVWARIFEFSSLRDSVKLAATCKSLFVLWHSAYVRDCRYQSMFGRRLPSDDAAGAEREMMISYVTSERWFGSCRAHLGEVQHAKPNEYGVGPSFVRGMIADETTVTTFDREKVKLWYHGAGARGDAGGEAGGRLASMSVEKKSSSKRGLTALAVNEASIIAGDDGGRLRIWKSDTLEYVQKRAHAIANDGVISALCGIPATSLVACASASAQDIEIWDTDEVASVTSVSLSDLAGSEHRGGVTCLSMFGGNSYQGRHRTFTGATSRMWAGTTFDKVVGVDLNRASFVDTLSLPEYCRGTSAITAIAVNGPLIATVVRGVGALMWDRRGYPREQIVATFHSHFECKADAAEEQSSCIDLEDYALWMSNPGDPGVSVFDIRKVFGPSRRQDRWVAGDATRHSVVSILRPRARAQRGAFSTDVNVGCFARVCGSPGVVVVAPDAESSEARCSIFSHKNVMPNADVFDATEIKDDGFRSRRSRQGKSSQPKARGRYPKRGGLIG